MRVPPEVLGQMVSDSGITLGARPAVPRADAYEACSCGAARVAGAPVPAVPELFVGPRPLSFSAEVDRIRQTIGCSHVWRPLRTR